MKPHYANGCNPPLSNFDPRAVHVHKPHDARTHGQRHLEHVAKYGPQERQHHNQGPNYPSGHHHEVPVHTKQQDRSYPFNMGSLNKWTPDAKAILRDQIKHQGCVAKIGNMPDAAFHTQTALGGSDHSRVVHSRRGRWTGQGAGAEPGWKTGDQYLREKIKADGERARSDFSARRRRAQTATGGVRLPHQQPGRYDIHPTTIQGGRGGTDVRRVGTHTSFQHKVDQDRNRPAGVPSKLARGDEWRRSDGGTKLWGGIVQTARHPAQA